jgi:hypothetical protein
VDINHCFCGRCGYEKAGEQDVTNRDHRTSTRLSQAPRSRNGLLSSQLPPSVHFVSDEFNLMKVDANAALRPWLEEREKPRV